MNEARRRWLLLLLLLLLFLTNLSSASAATDPQDVWALRALHGALGAPPQLTGWRLDGGDPCGEQWRGVSCSGPSVVSINIGGLGVGGYLGLQLAAFQSLKELDVSGNDIGGEIPYGLPPNATHINLAANSFVGNIPYSLPSLKHLIYINASHNRLSGPMGDVFTDMQSLEQLDLSFNSFSGGLPSSFTSLTNLHDLFLENNQFTGSVDFLANLPLSFLFIENNNFGGYVPKQFEIIPHLRTYGNLFQTGEVNPASLTNGTTQPPLISADPNASPPSAAPNAAPPSAAPNAPSPSVAPTAAPPSAAPNAPPPFENGATHTSMLPSEPNVSPSAEAPPSGYSHKRLSVGAMAGIIYGVVLVVIVLLAAAALMTFIHRFSYDLPISKPTEPGNFWMSNGTSRPSLVTGIKLQDMLRQVLSRHISLPLTKQHSVSDILAATNNYNNENLLGEGPISCVYKAVFPDGQTFAIKRFNKIEDIAYEDMFQDVAAIMCSLKHENLLTVRGYCVDHDEHVIIYDYAKNGSLDDFLRSDSQKVLPWKDRMMIALGAAQALRYLHTRYPPVVHGSIKTTNILLDDNLMPLLADCGQTPLRNLLISKQEGSELLPNLTFHHILEQSSPDIDERKHDIYSFGWVLLQLLTGKGASCWTEQPQFVIQNASTRLHDMSLLLDMVDPAIRGTVPHRSLSQFADVLSMCIQPDPRFRYQMPEITEDLSRLVNRMSLTAIPRCLELED